MRILWRLYSPYREHRKLIVKASYYLMEVVSLLEQLKEQVSKDYSKELSGKLVKPQTPPGYYDPNKVPSTPNEKTETTNEQPAQKEANQDDSKKEDQEST